MVSAWRVWLPVHSFPRHPDGRVRSTLLDAAAASRTAEMNPIVCADFRKGRGSCRRRASGHHRAAAIRFPPTGVQELAAALMLANDWVFTRPLDACPTAVTASSRRWPRRHFCISGGWFRSASPTRADTSASTCVRPRATRRPRRQCGLRYQLPDGSSTARQALACRWRRPPRRPRCPPKPLAD